MSNVPRNLSRMANQIGTEIAKEMGFAGVVIALLDYDNNLGICCSVSATADKAVMNGIARAIQNYSRDMTGDEITVEHSTECVYCRQEIKHSLAQRREHMATCAQNPVVAELAAAKQRIAQLEVDLADTVIARSIVTLPAPVWSPAPREEG